LKKLEQKAIDTLQQTRFSNYITYLEKTNPEKVLPEEALRQYVGEYQGGRTITLKNGKLFLANLGGIGGELHFIAPDLFMLSEGDVTLRFKRNKENQVSEVEGHWSLRSSTTVVAKIK
jgi:hypothetical protein